LAEAFALGSALALALARRGGTRFAAFGKIGRGRPSKFRDSIALGWGEFWDEIVEGEKNWKEISEYSAQHRLTCRLPLGDPLASKPIVYSGQ
jgi:hypothetical protein